MGIPAIFGVTLVLGVAGVWAAYSEQFRKYRIRAPKVMDPLPAKPKYRGIALNGLLSVGCRFLGLRFLSPWLLDEGLPPRVWLSEGIGLTVEHLRATGAA